MIFSKKKDLEAEKIQRDLIVSYKRVFGTPEGKTVLFDILDKCNVLNPHGGEDALAEGKRHVALMILSNCRINLEDFDRLLKGDVNEFAE